MALTINIQGGTAKGDADKCRNCEHALRMVTVANETVTRCGQLGGAIIRTKLAECSGYSQMGFKSQAPALILIRSLKDELTWHDGWGRQVWPEPPPKKRRRVGLNGDGSHE